MMIYIYNFLLSVFYFCFSKYCIIIKVFFSCLFIKIVIKVVYSQI